jgi:hypothetical protein
VIELRPGVRLRSAVCTTEVVVVRSAAVELRCGGQPMVLVDDEPHGSVALDLAHAAGTQLGKRYADPASGLEVLCTKGGEGSLAVGDAPLLRKDAKPLPSSD